MTDNDIINIDIEKYANALNDLLGADSAYFRGDKCVDALEELIALALKLESLANRQKAEIQSLNHEFNLLNKNI